MKIYLLVAHCYKILPPKASDLWGHINSFYITLISTIYKTVATPMLIKLFLNSA